MLALFCNHIYIFVKIACLAVSCCFSSSLDFYCKLVYFEWSRVRVTNVTAFILVASTCEIVLSSKIYMYN